MIVKSKCNRQAIESELIDLTNCCLSCHTEMSLGANETEEEIYSNSRTASIRSRSGSGRISTTDLERLSIPTAVSPPAPPSQTGILRTPRVYASVAEMKRVKVRIYKIYSKNH